MPVMLEKNFYYCFSLTLPSSGHLEKTHTMFVKTNTLIGVMRASSGLMWTINDDEKKKFFFSFFRMNVRARVDTHYKMV